MKKAVFLLAALPLLFAACSDNDDKGDKATIEISVNNTTIHNGEETTFSATADGAELKEVFFYFNGTNIGSKISEPFSIKYTPRDIEAGEHTVKVIARTKDNKDLEAECKVEVELRLGDEFQGGRIFELEKNGEHGLIAATSDLIYIEPNNTSTFAWGNSDNLNTGLDNGKLNTSLMVEKNPSSYNYAAYHFKDKGYVFNGYDDWYIPSINELNTLRKYKQFVGGFSNENAIYWSSSEATDDRTKALWININTDTQGSDDKFRPYRIRPIRAF